jgi:hypothetical protein
MGRLAERILRASPAELEAWARDDAATLRQVHAVEELARRAVADPGLLGVAVAAILPHLGASSRLGGLPTGYLGAKVLHDDPRGRRALRTALFAVPPLERYDLVRWLRPRPPTADLDAAIRELEAEEQAMPEGDAVTRVHAIFTRTLDVVEAVEPGRLPPAGADLLFTLALRLWHTYTPLPEALVDRADVLVRLHWEPAREDEAEALLGVAATLALPVVGDLSSEVALPGASPGLREAVASAIAQWRCGDPWESLRER